MYFILLFIFSLFIIIQSKDDICMLFPPKGNKKLPYNISLCLLVSLIASRFLLRQGRSGNFLLK